MKIQNFNENFKKCLENEIFLKIHETYETSKRENFITHL